MLNNTKRENTVVKVKFRLITFADAVEHLQGKKIIPAPDKFDCEYHPKPPKFQFMFDREITFFDDNSAMILVSDWDKGYYGDIDANEPLVYLGKVVENNV